MKLRPLHDRIIVRPLAAEEKTAGGIVIPDTAKEKPIEGEVVACGDGIRTGSGELVPLQVRPGDTVLFGKYAGTEIEFEGEHLLIMREADLFGVGGFDFDLSESEAAAELTAGGTHGQSPGDDE